MLFRSTLSFYFPFTHSNQARLHALVIHLTSTVIIFLLLVFAAGISAQTGVGSDEDVLNVPTNLITVPVLVSGNKGHAWRSLQREDFILLDNSRSVPIEYFAAGVERIAFTFVLDGSGSVREQIAQQRQAALNLFEAFKRSSRLAVIHFREQPETVVPFTTDAAKAERAFDIEALPERRSALFDAVLSAVQGYDMLANNPDERRIIVLISDGLDTASTTRAASIINEAARRGVSIYVLHLPLFTPRNGRLAARPTSKGFRDLATKTGGRFYVVGDVGHALNPHATYDFSTVFRDVEQDLRYQYVLGYYLPGGTDTAPSTATKISNTYHRINIRLSSKSPRNLRVRQLREGYYLNH